MTGALVGGATPAVAGLLATLWSNVQSVMTLIERTGMSTTVIMTSWMKHIIIWIFN